MFHYEVIQLFVDIAVVVPFIDPDHSSLGIGVDGDVLFVASQVFDIPP